MQKITQEELDKIIEQHKHWLNEDCEGWEDMRANLTCANLECANLKGATVAFDAWKAEYIDNKKKKIKHIKEAA